MFFHAMSKKIKQEKHDSIKSTVDFSSKSDGVWNIILNRACDYSYDDCDAVSLTISRKTISKITIWTLMLPRQLQLLETVIKNLMSLKRQRE